MKKNIQKLNKREFLIGIVCILVGMLITYLLIGNDVKNQKKLTSRILNNSIQSMEASKKMADSCADAYHTATTCVTNLKTCDIKEQAEKLDGFNEIRKHADQQIDWMNQDMKRIIEEVKINR